MEWQIILAITLAVPFIILIAVFVWFVNLGGIAGAIRRRHREQAARKFELAVSLESPKG